MCVLQFTGKTRVKVVDEQFNVKRALRTFRPEAYYYYLHCISKHTDFISNNKEKLVRCLHDVM